MRFVVLVGVALKPAFRFRKSAVRLKSGLFRNGIRWREQTGLDQIQRPADLQEVPLGPYIARAKQHPITNLALHREVPLVDLRISQALVDRREISETLEGGAERAYSGPSKLLERRSCPQPCSRTNWRP